MTFLINFGHAIVNIGYLIGMAPIIFWFAVRDITYAEIILNILCFGGYLMATGGVIMFAGLVIGSTEIGNPNGKNGGLP